MAAPTGICSICGTFGPLSYEHIPPEAAFNDRKILLADAKKLLRNSDWVDFEEPKGKWQQRGAGAYTLCGSCNSKTGHWYGSQYVDWAYQGMRHLHAVGAGSSLRLPYFISPLCVIKQIVSMFASACGPNFFEKNPILKRFILNPTLTGLPDEFRIFCYYVAVDSRRVRQAGITGSINIGGDSNLFSEIAFPPFGYILAINSEPIGKDLADITNFSRDAYKQFKDYYIQIPVRNVDSYFPADFRPMSEIRRDYLRNSLSRDFPLTE